jgi:hypothetical protein
MLRVYRLSKEYSVYMIHLIRNGEGCLNSILKRKGGSESLFKSFIFSIHWSIANLTALLYQFYKPVNYKRIQYETLINKPETSLEALFTFLKLDGEPVVEGAKKRETIPLTHQLSGNAIRREENLIINPNSDSLKFVTPFQKSVFRFFSWPVLKMMGY